MYFKDPSGSNIVDFPDMDKKGVQALVDSGWEVSDEEAFDLYTVAREKTLAALSPALETEVTKIILESSTQEVSKKTGNVLTRVAKSTAVANPQSVSGTVV